LRGESKGNGEGSLLFYFMAKTFSQLISQKNFDYSKTLAPRRAASTFAIANPYAPRELRQCIFAYYTLRRALKAAASVPSSR